MAIDTLIAYVGAYGSVEDAEADYQLVKDLHREAGLIDAYDAAVVERREDGKTRITKKHETPTRTGGGAILGAVAGHAAAGMSRHDLKELGEHPPRQPLPRGGAALGARNQGAGVGL